MQNKLKSQFELKCSEIDDVINSFKPSKINA